MSGSGYAVAIFDEISETALALQLNVEPHKWPLPHSLTKVEAAFYSLGAISVELSRLQDRTEYNAVFIDFYPEKWMFYHEFFEALAQYGGTLEAYFTKDTESICVHTFDKNQSLQDVHVGYNENPQQLHFYKDKVETIEEHRKRYSSGLAMLPPAQSLLH